MRMCIEVAELSLQRASDDGSTPLSDDLCGKLRGGPSTTSYTTAQPTPHAASQLRVNDKLYSRQKVEYNMEQDKW